MVSVVGKLCARQGCRKGASFGFEESRVKEYCATHAKHGMSGYWFWSRPGSSPSARAAGGSACGGGQRRRHHSQEAYDTGRRGGDLGRRLRSRATSFCETETALSSAGRSTGEYASKRARLYANDDDARAACPDPVKEEVAEGMAIDGSQGPSPEPEEEGVGQQARQEDEGAPEMVVEERGSPRK